MKVIHIIDSGGLYGAEAMLLALVHEQKKIDLDIEVVSIGKVGEDEKPIETELQLIGCRYYQFRMKPRPSIKQSIRLMNLCASHGATIVHSHGYKSNIMMAMIPFFLRPFPVVSTLHGYTKHKFLSKMTIYQFVDKLALRFLDAIVLVSPVMSVGSFGIKKKMKVIFNGVPMISSAETPNKKADDVFIIGTMGRLSKEKNFSFLVSLMPRILHDIPNAKLIIHGEGEMRAELEELVDVLGLCENVFLPGYTRDANQFFESIDVYVNSSTTEGMPITLLEAMRAKCLVLASNIPANSFLLKNKFKEFLYDLNSEAFIRSIIQLKNKSLQEKNSIKNQLNDFFIKEFTAKKMAENYKKLYMECL
ncbi:glycosyltransferase [Cellvibrio sp. PSBB023]|uniref:glycosyltransferase n=1 Tax=Cellvibrio sp. PSBB023 TaxID=1945512 RepID=UPI00098E9464|nr:glycosyltransferase [Cellvibrio sp. PSBB023]AQT61414.1 hypothetical protein B0D95_15850 [Cellvibrio sp. PSBB023]